MLRVVTPLLSLLLFSENGHVARRDWLFGGGGDPFFSSGGEEEFSILHFLRMEIYTSTPVFHLSAAALLLLFDFFSAIICCCRLRCRYSQQIQ